MDAGSDDLSLAAVAKRFHESRVGADGRVTIRLATTRLDDVPGLPGPALSPGARSAGVVFAPADGVYTFRLDAGGAGSAGNAAGDGVLLDGAVSVGAGEGVFLTRGFHAFRCVPASTRLARVDAPPGAGRARTFPRVPATFSDLESLRDGPGGAAGWTFSNEAPPPPPAGGPTVATATNVHSGVPETLTLAMGSIRDAALAPFQPAYPWLEPFLHGGAVGPPVAVVGGGGDGGAARSEMGLTLSAAPPAGSGGGGGGACVTRGALFLSSSGVRPFPGLEIDLRVTSVAGVAGVAGVREFAFRATVAGIEIRVAFGASPDAAVSSVTTRRGRNAVRVPAGAAFGARGGPDRHARVRVIAVPATAGADARIGAAELTVALSVPAAARAAPPGAGTFVATTPPLPPGGYARWLRRGEPRLARFRIFIGGPAAALAGLRARLLARDGSFSVNLPRAEGAPAGAVAFRLDAANAEPWTSMEEYDLEVRSGAAAAPGRKAAAPSIRVGTNLRYLRDAPAIQAAGPVRFRVVGGALKPVPP